MLSYSGMALALIVVILFMSFHWRTNSWLVLANVPFSLIGSVLAIAVCGIGISLGAVLGLVTVFGVSARNAILQLAHYEHLVEVEGAAWRMETVLRGANERLGIRYESAWSGDRRAVRGDSAWRPDIVHRVESTGTSRPGASLRS
jgi:Cu/Ag efflux pump CusA